MKNSEIRNKKIIDAVVAKAERVCPNSLALIGIYGSFATGDFSKKSDLDLLIVINDDNGWQLGCTFIQDDLEVGHDIYCTDWESLQEDSLYNCPNISKLMDSKIVYCADEKYMKKLEVLRKNVNEILSLPLSAEDYEKAENMLKEAEHFYLTSMLEENISDIRAQAGYVVYYVENAVAMLNKKYFRYGVKRVFKELELMELKPCNLCEMIENVVKENSVEEIKKSLTILIQETMRVFKKAKAEIPSEKNPPTADSVSGTYEEMFSNWRNKMYTAANENNTHLAFMSMASLNAMFLELSGKTDIGCYKVFEKFDPCDLGKTAQGFDDLMKEYLKEYEKVGLQAEHYKDIDAFIVQYLKF